MLLSFLGFLRGLNANVLAVVQDALNENASVFSGFFLSEAVVLSARFFQPARQAIPLGDLCDKSDFATGTEPGFSEHWILRSCVSANRQPVRFQTR